MMAYFIVFCASALNGICNVLGECYNRRVKKTDSFCYTAIISLIVFLFYFIYGGFSVDCDTLSAITACGYGACYCLTFVFMLRALKYGQVSLVSLVMAYSLMLPTFFGIFFYGDYPGLTFYVGLALLVFAVFLIGKKDSKPKGEEKREKSDGKWLIFSVLAMTTNGALSVLQTYQQKTTEGNYRSGFMMIAMAIVFLFSTVMVIVDAKKDKEVIAFNFQKGWWVASIYGIANALLNLAVMTVVNLLPAGPVFSTICGVSLVITLVLSVTLFKERLNVAQTVGFFVGLCSTVLMNL